MSKIGTKYVSVIEKPMSNTGEDEDVSAWAILTKNYLLLTDLGDDWRNCVNAWFELEIMLGFGAVSGTKVIHFSFLECLPFLPVSHPPFRILYLDHLRLAPGHLNGHVGLVQAANSMSYLQFVIQPSLGLLSRSGGTLCNPNSGKRQRKP